MYKLLLVRHGQSEWNKENRFTGWTDVSLSEQGIQEAKDAGKILKNEGYNIDIAFSSVLTRAIKTLHIILEEMDKLWIPIEKHWRLNERHYGALQGLNKTEVTQKHGEEQVKIWRRSYDICPPPLEKDDKRKPSNDPRYKKISESELPYTECLKDTVSRFVPYWQQTIAPAVRTGKNVIIAAHGNSLRALIKYLDGISDEQIISINIPTGIPLLYELDDNLSPIQHKYLGDTEAVTKAQAEVANQGKA